MSRFSGSVHALALLSVACLAAPTAAQVDSATHPFVEAVTDNRGAPTERLDHLRLRPELVEHIRAHRPLAPYVRRVLPQVAHLRDSALVERDALALQTVRDEGWAQFNLIYTLGGSVSTLAENVGQLGGLTATNEIMSTLGLLMTAWQVTMDLSNNNEEAAALNAYQGAVLYQLARWGTANVQVASVGVGLMNIAIQAFGQAAQAENTGAWRARYTEWYRDLETAAEARTRAALRGGGYLSPTFDEDLRRVRGAMAQGYSRHDWATLLTFYLREARTGQSGFEALMQRAIDEYVGLYWASDDPALSQPGLNDTVRAALNAENRRRVALMLSREVLPEVAALALVMELNERLPEASTQARPEQNAPLDLVVTAHGLEGPVSLEMPRPAGGVWRPRRQVEPGQSLTLRMTRLAWLRAGGPDTIRLMHPEGVEEGHFAFDDGERAVVVFGQPEDPAQLRYSVDEGAQSCVTVTRAPDGATTRETLDRPARGTWELHSSLALAATAGEAALIGRYRPGTGWNAASPIAISSEDGRAVWTVAEPGFDDLARITCEISVPDPQTAAEMAEMVGAMGTNIDMDCRFTREDRAIRAGTETLTRCESAGAMRITGLLVPLPDGPRFMDPNALMPDQDELRGAMELLMQQGGGTAPVLEGGVSQ